MRLPCHLLHVTDDVRYLRQISLAGACTLFWLATHHYLQRDFRVLPNISGVSFLSGQNPCMGKPSTTASVCNCPHREVRCCAIFRDQHSTDTTPVIRDVSHRLLDMLVRLHHLNSLTLCHKAWNPRLQAGTTHVSNNLPTRAPRNGCSSANISAGLRETKLANASVSATGWL